MHNSLNSITFLNEIKDSDSLVLLPSVKTSIKLQVRNNTYTLLLKVTVTFECDIYAKQELYMQTR